MAKKDSAPAVEEGNGQSVEADNAEVQRKMDEYEAQGYIGSVPDPIPNEAYSIKSGPDAPALVPDNQTRVEQYSAPKENK